MAKKTEAKAQAAATQVKTQPMEEVSIELKEETVANVVKQDNKSKPKPAKEVEILDADNAKAGIFPQIDPRIYEAMYSRTKVIEEVSKPIVMKDLEAAIDAMHTKLRFDLPTEINILCCRVILGTIVYGNVWPARKLLQAFGAAPKGSSKTMFRVVALRNWLIDKGPFKPWQDAGDMMDYTTGKAVENAKGLVIDGNRRRELEAAFKKDQAKFIKELAETPFWVHQPVTEAAFAKFDLKKEFAKLLKRAATMESRLAEHKQGDDIHLEGLQVLRQIAPKLHVTKEGGLPGQDTIDPAERNRQERETQQNNAA